MDITDLHNLPVADKLRLVTQLWDDIAASKEQVVLPPVVMEEASHRSAELIADPYLAIDEAELWRRIE